jgi:hypothetical protein
MDKMPIIAVLLQGIPESIVVYCFGMAIVGEYIDFKRILIVSIITPFLMMFVRSVVPVFGVHLFISVLIIFIMLWILLKLEYKKAILSSLLSFSILLLLETLILPIFFNKYETSYTQIFGDNMSRIFYGYPIIIIYAILIFIVYYFKLPLIKGSRVKLNEQKILD